MQAARAHHDQGIVVAKMTIEHQMTHSQYTRNALEQILQPVRRCAPVPDADGGLVLVLAALGTATLPLSLLGAFLFALLASTPGLTGLLLGATAHHLFHTEGIRMPLLMLTNDKAKNAMPGMALP